MEIIRFPSGGLNLDDSPELIDAEDWTDAVNIIDGRSRNAKNGEKENIRGTTILNEDLSIGIIVNENNTFSDWINTDTGHIWTLGEQPAIVDIDGSSSSRKLTYNPPVPVTGWFPVKFSYQITNLAEATITIFCEINGGAEVQSAVIQTTSGELSFLFDSAVPITSVSIYLTTGPSTPPSVNSSGGGGDYETLASTWGFAAAHGTTTRSSLFKTSGNYSMKYKHIALAAPSTSVTQYALARVNGPDAPTGKRLFVSANVLTPSSAQIDQSSFELYIQPTGFGASFTPVTNTNKTVGECINTWQTIDAVFDVINPNNAPIYIYVAVKDPTGINSTFTLSEGEIYVDEFYVTGDTTPQSISLSGVSIFKNSFLTDILNNDSKLVGVIRSAKDDLSYLFFYNTNPDKHCIIKLQNDVISLVLAWNGLNFSPLKEHRIQGGVAGELIYFTDNRNQPRCVHENRYTGGAIPVKEEEILWIKRGPLAPPIFTKQTTFGYIVIKDDIQFATQFVYIDGQQSVLSPFSKICRIETKTDSYNDILITLDPTDEIPSNVLKIKYIVKRGNGAPTVFSERAPTDDTPVSFHIGTESDVVDSIFLKNFENVPLLAKCATISKSRAWLGNYIEGYDTPTGITIDYAFETSEAWTADEGPVFDNNSSRKLGALLFDSSGRSCGVIPLRTSSGADAILSVLGTVGHEGARRKLKFRLQGTPPPWAVRWSLVVSDDLIKSFYLNGIINFIGGPPPVPLDSTLSSYIIVDKDEVETFSPSSWTADAKYIRISLEGMNTNGLYYSHKPGDQLLIDDNNLGGYAGPFEIVKQVGSFIYVPSQNIGNFTISSQNRFQIFTPRTTATGAYYEIGHSSPIVGGAFNTEYDTWAGPSIQVAYQRQSTTDYIAEMSIHKNGTWNDDSGRISVVTEIGQSIKSNFFKCSSPFISGININGLSEFNIGDEKSVSFEAGEIQKLQPTSKESTEGDVILAICNSDTFSVYIDEARVSTGDTTFLVASANVIGDVRKQKSGFGTLHPESVHEEDGYVYAFDKLSRAFTRYATNGIYPISEYKAVAYFEEQAKLNAIEDTVVCGYDPFYKIILVTFTNAASSAKKTFVFSTLKERWIGWFTFAPDGYVIGSDKMYSVVGGNIYKHDNETLFNNFYGTQYDSKFSLSFNDASEVPKEWKTLQIQASPNFYSFSQANQVIGTDALKADITNRHGQATDILYNEFEVDENMIYGEIRGDKNSPGGVLNGDPIFSNTIQLDLTMPGPAYKRLLLVKAGFEPSRGHTL